MQGLCWTLYLTDEPLVQITHSPLDLFLVSGLMLFEQHIPQMLYAQSRYRYGELTGKKLKDELENVRDVLKEAVEILKLEDPASPEGSIAVGGLESLKELEESILTVQV